MTAISKISGNPTPEEVAAITAAISELESAGAFDPAGGVTDDGSLKMWVHASRRSAQRAGMQRGPWRMSGRLPRRSRT